MTRIMLALSLFMLMLMLMLAAVPSPAAAQTYPARPIRIVVPYPPGGTSDILARSLGEKLTGSLGQPVVVENKPGANGNLGADFVAKAPPDGYTLLLGDIGALAISPSVYPTLPFDPVRDFAPVTMVAYSPHILVVNPAVPVNSMQELVALAKSKPGKLNFAISGVGGAPHLAGVEFAADERDPGRSDNRGIRPAGLRNGIVARRDGAAGHTARDRRAAQRRD